MKITLEMPQVARCDIDSCAYNRDKSCHARAITVGDERRPGCDTFCNSSMHTKEKQRIAGVGACKVTNCRFNSDFECEAREIEVGHSGQDILCLTYKER